MPRIFLINTLSDGGIAHYTQSLAKALFKNKIDVILITPMNYEFEKNKNGFEIYNIMFRFAFRLIRIFPLLSNEFGLSNILRRVLKIAEYPINIIEIIIKAKQKRINLIHIQSVNEIELLMIMALKVFGYKVIFTIHNVFPRHGELTNFHKKIYKYMYSLCDHLIIHTESGKNQVVNLFKINKEKIIVIPHGNYNLFVPEKIITNADAKKELGFEKNTKTILFFGAIRSNKGLNKLLEALPIVVNSYNNVKCMIVGEPFDDYINYKNQIDEYNLNNYIFEELGYIENTKVPLFFGAADIVVLPYLEVTGSGVLQIAYAFGKPVIASNLEGFVEVIEENKNGFLVDAEKTSDLADRIISLFDNEKLLKSMGNHSKYLGKTKYSWESIARKTSHLYSNLESFNTFSAL
jgi:glycosyltransferase involved in cell wall biosynthesis